MPKNDLIVAAAIQKGDVIRPDYYYSGLTVTSSPKHCGSLITFEARVLYSDGCKSSESVFSIHPSAPVVLLERSEEAR